MQDTETELAEKIKENYVMEVRVDYSSMLSYITKYARFTAIPLQDGQLQLISESKELQKQLASLQVRLQ